MLPGLIRSVVWLSNSHYTIILVARRLTPLIARPTFASHQSLLILLIVAAIYFSEPLPTPAVSNLNQYAAASKGEWRRISSCPGFLSSRRRISTHINSHTLRHHNLRPTRRKVIIPQISPLSTSNNASPTSPKPYHRQRLRPLYMPAVLRPTEHPSKNITGRKSEAQDDDSQLSSNNSFISLSGLGALSRLSRRTTGDSGKWVEDEWNLDLFPKPTAQPTRQHWKVSFGSAPFVSHTYAALSSIGCGTSTHDFIPVLQYYKRLS